MGMPAADIPYVLEKLAAIEGAILHLGCDTSYSTHPLKLVRELENELGNIFYGTPADKAFNHPRVLGEDTVITLSEEDTKAVSDRQMLVGIIRGIKDSDIWADDWCPVCQEHPSSDHGGRDCPLKEAIQTFNKMEIIL